MDGDGEFNGRTLAGWYLQQFLKLGASQYLPDLSRYFLIWDMDMILLQRLSPFYPSYSRKLQHVGQKTVVHIGGARNPGYEFAYKQLTGVRDTFQIFLCWRRAAACRLACSLHEVFSVSKSKWCGFGEESCRFADSVPGPLSVLDQSTVQIA